MLDAILNSALALLLSVLFFYKWVVIISSLISWFNLSPYNPIVNFLYSLTNPVYAYIRRYINTTFANMDLAPLIVIFAIIFIEELIKNLIIQGL